MLFSMGLPMQAPTFEAQRFELPEPSAGPTSQPLLPQLSTTTRLASSGVPGLLYCWEIGGEVSTH
jgi:hypothetical protein